MKHSLRFFGNFLGLNFQTLFKMPFLTKKDLRVVDTFVAKRVRPTIQDNVPYCPSAVVKRHVIVSEIYFDKIFNCSNVTFVTYNVGDVIYKLITLITISVRL